MRVQLILFCLLLFVGSAAAGDTTTIEGFLTSADTGTSIDSAFILLHDFNGSPSEAQYSAHNMEMRTGPDGRFVLKVDVGCYDLFVSAMWFAPHAERICVQKDRAAKVRLKMKANRSVMLRMD